MKQIVYPAARVFGIFLLLGLMTGRVFSQQYHIRSISTRDGLPSSSVYKAFEDSKGYTWFLTDKGISRFDGRTHRIFTAADGFTDLSAFHMAEAPDGRLWFVSLNFRIFYFEKEGFFHLRTDKEISWIDIDPQGRIWMLGRRGNYFEFINRKGLVKVFEDSTASPGFSYNYSFLHLGDGRFLKASHDKISLIEETGKTKMLLAHSVFRTFVTPRFFRLSDGRVLVTGKEGIYEYSISTSGLQLRYPFKGNQVFSCAELASNGDIYIGTFLGLYVFNRNNLRSPKEILFKGNIVSGVAFDKDQNCMVSTWKKGFYIYNMHAVHVDTRDKEGVSGSIEYIKKENGAIYTFSINAMINRLKGKKLEKMAVHPYGIDEIKSVLSVRDTIIHCLGTVNFSIHKGIMHKSYIREDFVPINTKAEDGIYLQGGECVMIGSYGNLVISGDTARRIREALLREGLTGVVHPMRVLNGMAYYWVPRGVIGISNHDSKRNILYRMEGQITEINFTRNGHAVISTLNNGLGVFRKGHFLHIDTRNGMLSSYCRKTYVLGHFIWVCTNKGLTRIRMTEEDRVHSMTNFTSNDFLLSDEVNDVLVNDTEVIVATDAGLSFFPSNAYVNRQPPSVLIERLQINNKDTPWADYFDLPWSENNITLQFNSPGMRERNTVLYRYVLKGAKPDTVYMNNVTLQLGSLQPGNYLLKVWGRNIDGLWSLKPAELNFRIRNPFWKSYWFVISFAIFIISLTWYFVYSRLRENRFRFMLLSSELKALRLYMNPHFIFNSLNSLHSYVLKRDKESASAFIVSFSRLIRTIMNHSARSSVSISEEKDLLELYLGLERTRFNHSFDYAIHTNGLENTDYRIPTLLIQPFVENAIKYGMAGTTNGQVEVWFSMKENYIECIVEDNGPGRAFVEEQLNIAGRDHESSGIHYIRERLKLLFGKTVPEPVVIIDKQDAGGNPTGTRIRIKLPAL